MKTNSCENSDGAAGTRMEHPSSADELGCFSIRLKEVIGNRSVRGFASECGLSQASMLSYLSGDTFPSLDRLAAIAQAAGRPMAWFVGGAEAQASPELRREALTMALQLAAEALDGKTLPPQKYAELVSLIYEGLAEGLPQAQILRFARIAAP